MYNDKYKINSAYFNKKTKKIKKKNKLTCICFILMSTLIFIVYLNINLKKPSEIKDKNFIKKSKNNDVLPPKPKEKWKYIEKLENS
ncbi:hypothetical protein Buap_5540 [Buchnera aphidicola str. APS (Acyrthosiphon pisum)]